MVSPWNFLTSNFHYYYHHYYYHNGHGNHQHHQILQYHNESYWRQIFHHPYHHRYRHCYHQDRETSFCKCNKFFYYIRFNILVCQWQHFVVLIVNCFCCVLSWIWRKFFQAVSTSVKMVCFCSYWMNSVWIMNSNNKHVCLLLMQEILLCYYHISLCFWSNNSVST